MTTQTYVIINFIEIWAHIISLINRILFVTKTYLAYNLD